MSVAATIGLTGLRALDASAGTGKTYSIALVHLRLVLAGIPVGKILVTTFTDAAAAELRGRLRARLVETRDGLAGVGTHDADLEAILHGAASSLVRDAWRSHIERALSDFDLAPVCTIHSFCRRLLRDHALELGAVEADEIAAEDPRLALLAGDFLASRTLVAGDSGGDGSPDPRDLMTIGRRIREYRLKVPAAVRDSVLAANVDEPWIRSATARLNAARSAWDREGGGIAGAIRALVEKGSLKGGVFDNPGKDGSQRWKKLDNSIGETRDFLAKVPNAETWTVPGPVVRLAADALLKASTPEGRRDVERLLRDRGVFQCLEAVATLSRELESARKSAGLRALEQEFMESVGDLHPEDALLYSDLVNAVFERLGDRGFVHAVRAGFDAVLVDECQDTDARQLEVFLRLFGDAAWMGRPPSRCLVWVGDPKQSIYRFRGADIDTYVRARRGAKQETLDTNHRADRPLVAAVNALFRGPPGSAPVFRPDIPFAPARASRDVRVKVRAPGDAEAFCLHTWDAGERPPSTGDMEPRVLSDCARSIGALLRSNLSLEGADGHWRRVRAGDLAVLAPRRRQLEALRRRLLHDGIPAAYRTDSSVYLTDEARDLRLLLQALASPRLPLVRAALATPAVGFTLQEVSELGEAALAPMQQHWLALADRVAGEGFLPVLFSILREPPGCGESPLPRALVRLAGRTGGERTLTNLVHLGERLQTAWRDGHARSAEALRDFLDKAMARAENGAEAAGEEEAKLRLETDAPAVLLSTIHSFKGLQHPIVFLPFLWSEAVDQEPPCVVVHDDHGGCRLVLPGDRDWGAERQREKDRLDAEKMRLLYVALTRAEHQVHAWWGRAKNASRWTVSSTRSAWGRLLLRDPRGAESHTDAECVKAFEDAMARETGTTFAVVRLGQDPEWFRTPSPDAADGDPRNESADEPRAAPWSRAFLSAAPLRSSYSAFLRQKTEGHRGDDEVELPATAGDEIREAVPSATAPGGDLLAPFRGGKVLGDRVHGAFESAFAAHDETTAGDLFTAALAPDLRGLQREGDPAIDGEATSRNLWDATVATPIASGRLGDLLASDHVSEWGFLLPQSESLSPESLAGVLERNGADTPWGRSDYVSRVRQLGFSALTGYFEGIVDLLGRLGGGGPWVLVDYKTNRLDGYGPAHLSAAMAECHYLLQALLYSVAAERWLRRSIQGWCYERDFAGAAYLFLRGQRKGASQGVWFGKPPAGLVRAMDGFFPARPEATP